MNTEDKALYVEEMDNNKIFIPVNDDVARKRRKKKKPPVKILEAYEASPNIMDFLEDSTIRYIGDTASEEYKIDKLSRHEWEELHDKALVLAKMISKTKSYPWPDASNVMYPLLAQAAIQFNARAMPNIVPDVGGVVKTKVIGADEGGEKKERAERVRIHMNYDIAENMPGWEEGMDRLLIYLPLIGTCFKKTFRVKSEGKNVSELVLANDLIVNNDATCLEKAPRISHLFQLTPNQIEGRKRTGVFAEDFKYNQVDSDDKEAVIDNDAEHSFVEQHRLMDLDGDGYKEPYIVTFHLKTGNVARIKARWRSSGITAFANGEIQSIKPIHYFTKYSFIPNPDGKFYDMGFGMLFGFTNDSINTIINQLLDAGHNENVGGGFMSARLKMKLGMTNRSYRFIPGEWKQVSMRGDDIRKEVFPRPTQQPSQTLFQLLGFIVESTEKAISATDVLSGQQSLANVPATTTMALIEQGLKVFTAIYKRIHRSLKEEFKKLYELNRLYLEDEVYFNVTDRENSVARADYEAASCDIIPVSDPQSVNDAQKYMRAEMLFGLLGQGFNDDEIRKRYLILIGEEDPDALLEKSPPAVDPKVELEIRKLDLEEKKFEMSLVREQIELEKILEEARKIKADAILSLAKAEAEEVGPQLDEYKNTVDGLDQQITMLTAITQRQMATINQQQQSGGTDVKPEPGVS